MAQFVVALASRFQVPFPMFPANSHPGPYGERRVCPVGAVICQPMHDAFHAVQGNFLNDFIRAGKFQLFSYFPPDDMWITYYTTL